jgi:hypothetical protein
VVNEYEVGMVLDEHSPKNIAESINALLQDEHRRERYHQNCLKARAHLNWENEEKELISHYNSIASTGK